MCDVLGSVMFCCRYLGISFPGNISDSGSRSHLYYLHHFWPTELSVAPLSSVCLSSVTFCIVAKRYVLSKNCLKEWIGNQGQKVDFLGHRQISTSGFASMATEMAVFVLFLPVQPSNRYYMVQMEFLAANHVRIVGLCGQNWSWK